MKVCPFCSTKTEHIYHRDKCPKVEDVKYYPDGQIKSISFFEHSEIRQPANDAVLHLNPNLEKLSAEIDERMELIRIGFSRSIPA